MHVTGMAAAAFDPASICLAAPQQLSTLWLAAAIACCTALLLTGTMLIRGGENSILGGHTTSMGVGLKIGSVLMIAIVLVAAFVVASVFLLVAASERAATLEAENVAMAIAQASGDNAIADAVRAQRYVDRVNRNTGRDMFFVDLDRRIVADSDHDEIGMVFSGDPDHTVDRTLADGLGRTFIEVSPPRSPSRQFVAALRRDLSDVKSPIIGAVVLEYTQIFEALQAEALHTTYLIAAIGVAVVFLTAVLGLRAAMSIAPPLIALTRGAQLLAAGKYGARVKVTSRDEFGTLAAAFNRMAEDLQASHDQLMEQHRDLETMVDARTSELQSAEGAQRQLARELRMVTEHMPVAMCYLDRELRYHQHNQRYAELTGFADDQIDGRLLSEVITPGVYAIIKDPIARTLEGQQVVYERPRVAEDENSGRLETTLVPRIDADGAVVGFYSMIQDISERKRAEDALRQNNAQLKAINQQLRQAQNQLLQAGKMASIGQLAAGVAHEINNPIGYVFSNLGTLDHYLGDMFTLIDRYQAASETIVDEAVLADLRSARETAEIDFVKTDIISLLAESKEGITRVKKIVLDLKNFSRSAGDEAWQWADLHLGIDSTLNVVWNELKYKAEVCKLYGELPQVQCRPSQLNQVFLNMLVNGADAIPERGTINIRSGVEGDNVWIEFGDTGVGIAPDQLDQIFDPFFTTKPVDKGTGLGLSVSYGIVKEHNGRIDVTSEVGKGTTFKVWLPIRQATDEDPPITAKRPTDAATPLTALEEHLGETVD
jgi:PAS domain S-box-containing protein